jgi:hypothetical protein
MTGLELRPMTLGEILDRTFILYRRHFRLFIGIMLLPQVLILALQVIFTVLPLTMAGSNPANVNPSTAVFAMLGVLAVLPFVMLGYLCAYAVAQGATVSAVSCLAMGAPTSVSQAYRQVRRRFWRVVLVVFLVWMAVGAVAAVSLMAAMIPGTFLLVLAKGVGMVLYIILLVAALALPLWLFSRMGVAVAAAVLEPGSGVAALSRSMELTSGYAGRVFVAAVFVIVLTIAAVGVFQMPLWFSQLYYAQAGEAPVWLAILVELGSFLGGLLVGPIGAIAFALIYYDLRVRKEGFDLQLMIHALDAAAPAPAAPAPAAGS